MFGKILTKRLIDRSGIPKDARNVRFQQHDIGAFLVAFVVLAPNSSTEIVFGPHFIVGLLTLALLHKRVVLPASHPGH